MKLRNTLILLVLVAGMFAYIKWVDSKKLSDPEKAEIERHPFRQFEQERVKLVTIRNRDATPVQISLKDGVWRLESPIKDRAQEFDVKKVLGQLDLLTLTRVSDTAPTKDQLKAYGLQKPEFTVKVDADKSVEISFGEETTLRGTYYVKIEGRDTVYTTQTSIQDDLARKPEEWRDRTLSPLSPEAVKKVNIKMRKGEIEIEKSGQYWSLVKPLKARADMHQVADLLATALHAQVQEFVTDAKDLSTFGLTEPRATLTFTPEGAEAPVVLEIGAAKPDKDADKKAEKPEPGKAPEKKAQPTVYVKMTGREGVVTVLSSIESLIDLQPNDLRDLTITRVQKESVNRITIEAPGKEKIVLERTLSKDQTSEVWMRKTAKGDQPINTSAAARLLTELATGKADHFVADMASDLKGFGLDQPQIIVTLADYSANNTAETQAGELEQAKLFIGRVDGDVYYAKLSNEPFIFAISKDVIDHFWTNPIQWQPLEIRDLKADEIATLDITRTGQPTLSLIREGKTWALAKGDGKVNQNAVEALVGTLAKLRAVRWVGATVPEHGLDKPNLTIAYTLTDKKAGKLLIGAVTPMKQWNASVDGDKATFQIAGPHFDALNAAVIESTKPPAEAPPGNSGPAPSVPAPGSNPPVVVPPAEEPSKPAEPSKPTEAPASGTKPSTPETPPKGQ